MTELRSFPGLCNVFRHFVPNFDHGAAHLDKKRLKFQLQIFHRLTENEITALKTLNAKVVELHVGISRVQGAYTVDADAFRKHIGCVFLQNSLTELEI